jgi:hypothetical protein
MGKLGNPTSQPLSIATTGHLVIDGGVIPPAGPVFPQGGGGPSTYQRKKIRKSRTLREITRRERLLREDDELLEIIEAMLASGVFDEL